LNGVAIQEISMINRSLSIRILVVVLAVSAAMANAAEPAAAAGAKDSVSMSINRTSLKTLPTQMLVERLIAMGHQVKLVVIANTSAEIRAGAANSVDITSASMTAQLPAMDAGLDRKVFLSRYTNPFVLIAEKDIKGCDGLNGKTLTVATATDISGVLAREWLAAKCPSVKTSIQSVPNGKDRLSALIQGAANASVLDLEDATTAMHKAPGKYAILADLAKEYPIVGGAYSALPKWLEEHKAFVHDFIAADLDVQAAIYANPAAFKERAKKLLSAEEPEVVSDAVDLYLADKIFPADGDLATDRVQQTIEFSAPAGGFKHVRGPDDVVDRRYLDAVLAARRKPK
jgi:ABC-type nitrate/sulfonate/bicarbonate transport system substrate-binding protein